MKPSAARPLLLAALAVAGLLLGPAPRLPAAPPPTDAALLARYGERRAEFRQLAALLAAQGGSVFGPRYGEWARLKTSLGLKTFQGTGGQNRLGLRFPVALRTDLFQLTRGATRGFAWMPNPPALLQAESDRAHRFAGEPPARFLFTDPRGPTPPAPRASRGQYAVTLRRIEGPWFLYQDNNPFHSGW